MTREVGNLQETKPTWMFVLGRAASTLPPSFALYLVRWVAFVAYSLQRPENKSCCFYLTKPVSCFTFSLCSAMRLKQFKQIWFWRCFQLELVPPYESLVYWHLFDQLLLFGCTWTQSPLIKITGTNKMIKCHLSLVSESPSAAPGRSRWSRSLTPLWNWDSYNMIQLLIVY